MAEARISFAALAISLVACLLLDLCAECMARFSTTKGLDLVQNLFLDEIPCCLVNGEQGVVWPLRPKLSHNIHWSHSWYMSQDCVNVKLNGWRQSHPLLYEAPAGEVPAGISSGTVVVMPGNGSVVIMPLPALDDNCWCTGKG